MPQVVPGPLVLLVPRGLVTTTRTRLARGGALSRDDLWRWQVGNRGDPFGGIGSIRSRTAHGCVRRARMWRPALYDKCPAGAIPKPGKDAIVSRSIGLNFLTAARAITPHRNPRRNRMPPDYSPCTLEK